MNKQLELPKNHIALICYNEVKNIVKPLEKLLNINYFCFRRIYNNGKHIALTANPEWLIRYYNNKYYLKKETRKVGAVGNFYPVIWDHITDKDKFSDQAMIDARNHDFAHSLSLKYIAPEYMDLYSLSVPLEDDQVSEKYLRYYESIKKFVFYFQSNAALLINEAEKNPIDTENTEESKPDNIVSEIDKFEQQIKITQLNLNLNGSIIKLTATETKYLKELALGVSSKCIAKKLNVSTRTVETHIDNLKLKLGVYSKSSIISKLNNRGLDFNLID